MKRRTDGVVVYSARIPSSGKMSIGAWIGHPISSERRAQLMQLNETAGLGHVGVRTNSRRTTVKYIGPAASAETEKHRTPRQIAVRLARAVHVVLGTKPTLRPLKNAWLVERALA